MALPKIHIGRQIGEGEQALRGARGVFLLGSSFHLRKATRHRYPEKEVKVCFDRGTSSFQGTGLQNLEILGVNRAVEQPSSSAASPQKFAEHR